MKIHVEVNIQPQQLLKSIGLEPNGRVQQMFTSRCAAEMDRYVPMQQGILKNTRIIEGDKVTYNSPHAKNMYYGVVMVDPITKAAGFLTAKGWRSRKGVKKIKSDREYKYHGAPLRGKLWDKRMWAEKGEKIIKDVATAIKEE